MAGEGDTQGKPLCSDLSPHYQR